METQIMTVLIISAVVSVISSFIVILTPIIFPRMRSKLFQQIVCFISIGDIIGNISYVFPFRPSSGTAGCDIEAFFNYSGYPMEWLWTTALSYLLYEIAMRGRVPKSMVPLHVVCWGLPIVLALFTLSVSKYEKNTNPVEVCRMNLTSMAMNYHWASYYGLYFLCLMIMLVLYVKIYMLELKKDPRVVKLPFRVAKQALTWYPLAMIIFWAPHMVSAIQKTPNSIYIPLLILKVYHGLAVSILFFYQSVESRWLWYSAYIVPCLPGMIAFYCEWYLCGFHYVVHRSHRALNYVSQHRRTEFDLSSPVGTLRTSHHFHSAHNSTSTPLHHSEGNNSSFSQNDCITDVNILAKNVVSTQQSPYFERDSSSSVSSLARAHHHQNSQGANNQVEGQDNRHVQATSFRASYMICIDDILDLQLLEEEESEQYQEDVAIFGARPSHKHITSFFSSFFSSPLTDDVSRSSNVRHALAVKSTTLASTSTSTSTGDQLSHMEENKAADNSSSANTEVQMAPIVFHNNRHSNYNNSINTTTDNNTNNTPDGSNNNPAISDNTSNPLHDLDLS